jgi:uncharacterized protein (TIGR02147 family)
MRLEEAETTEQFNQHTAQLLRMYPTKAESSVRYIDIGNYHKEDQYVSTKNVINLAEALPTPEPTPTLRIVADSPKVFAFLNYREFLLAFYNHRKSVKPSFSYRVFSRLAKMPTSTYMHMIIKGKRDLTPSKAKAVATACRLTPDESKYFSAIVNWNQCTDEDSKRALWEHVLKSASKDPVFEFNQSHLRLLTKWSTVAIMELIRLQDFQFDSHWIQKRFCHSISEKEINEAIKTLMDLNLVTMNGGRLEVTNKLMLFKKGMPSATTKQVQHEIVKMGLDAIDNVDVNDREISTATLSIRKEKLPLFKEEMRKFQLHLVHQLANDNEPDEIYELAVLLFPLTKRESK